VVRRIVEIDGRGNIYCPDIEKDVRMVKMVDKLDEELKSLGHTPDEKGKWIV